LSSKPCSFADSVAARLAAVTADCAALAAADAGESVASAAARDADAAAADADDAALSAALGKFPATDKAASLLRWMVISNVRA
jgi:hypothetical protein